MMTPQIDWTENHDLMDRASKMAGEAQLVLAYLAAKNWVGAAYHTSVVRNTATQLIDQMEDAASD